MRWTQDRPTVRGTYLRATADKAHGKPAPRVTEVFVWMGKRGAPHAIIYGDGGQSWKVDMRPSSKSWWLGPVERGGPWGSECSSSQ